MFNLLFGAALMRWLAKMGTTETEESNGSHPTTPPESTTPQIDLTDYTVVVPPKPLEYVYPTVQRHAMGSLFEVYLAGTDRETLVAAAEEALNEVERLERQLSHYRDDSDIARLNKNAKKQWVRLEPKLYALLKHCAQITEETDGAFDVTAGPLIKAWGFYRGEGRIPENDEIKEILQNVGIYRILFDDDDHLVYFTAKGLDINLGAVGKGYAMDAAAETLGFFGVKSAVVHGGQSTIYALGSPPDAMGWEFTVKDPRDRETPIETVLLRDEAISTSGNYEQFFEVDGVRYSHIIDPMTGRPAQGIISVSVIAPSAADSDALSTAFFVLGRERTEEYCLTHPNIRVIMVEARPLNEIEVTRIGF